MATVTIVGVPPFDGVYDFDPATLTGTEWHTIKKISGVRAGEFADAFTAIDYDLIIALAVVALRRHGLNVIPEHLMEAVTGAIKIDLGTAVEEPRPPASAPQNGGANKDDALENNNEKPASSGHASNETSDHQENDPTRTGGPGSDTSADSDHLISAT